MDEFPQYRKDILEGLRTVLDSERYWLLMEANVLLGQPIFSWLQRLTHVLAVIWASQEGL